MWWSVSIFAMASCVNVLHPDQMFGDRPVAAWSSEEKASYETPLQNLFMAGGGCAPGPGVTCLPGMYGAKLVLEYLDSGEMAIAFSLYPTSINDLMAVADDDQVMPPKSTWFEPKLRSGLFVHRIGDPMPSAPSSV